MSTLRSIQSYTKTIKIDHPVDGLISPTLNSAQVSWICKWINNVSTADVVSRQLGSSTAQSIFTSFKAVDNPYQNILIRSNKMDRSRMSLFNIRKILESADVEFKIKNNTTLKLNNSSTITTEYDCNVKYDLVVLDQLGYSNEFIIPDEYNQIIIQSTATMKPNIFYKIITSPRLLGHDINISINPWNVIPRRKNWKVDMIRRIGQERFNIEYMCLFGDML